MSRTGGSLEVHAGPNRESRSVVGVFQAPVHQPYSLGSCWRCLVGRIIPTSFVQCQLVQMGGHAMILDEKLLYKTGEVRFRVIAIIIRIPTKSQAKQ